MLDTTGQVHFSGSVYGGALYFDQNSQAVYDSDMPRGMKHSLYCTINKNKYKINIHLSLKHILIFSL